MLRLKKCRGDREKKLAIPCLESLTSLLSAPWCTAVRIEWETCPRCLSRVWYVWWVVFSVLLILKVCHTAQVGLRHWALAPLWVPVAAEESQCQLWWCGLMEAWGSASRCLHHWRCFHPRGGWWRIRNWHAFYFLNNTLFGCVTLGFVTNNWAFSPVCFTSY